VNFALPAVLVILGLIPGILFQRGYFSGRFPRHLATNSQITEFTQYFVFALPIDALAMAYLGEEQRSKVFSTVLSLISSRHDNEHLNLLASVWRSATWYYLLICAVAFVAGVLIRRGVWAFRLDLIFLFLRMKSEYFYLLQGRQRGLPRVVLPYADVLSIHEDRDDGARLYRGLVTEFSLTSSGEIKELVLDNAYRGKGRGDKFEWREIPTDGFLLIGNSIQTINMRYFLIEEPMAGLLEEPVAGLIRRSRHWLGSLMRSFVFEDP
jgi:hypothetical protein